MVLTWIWPEFAAAVTSDDRRARVHVTRVQVGNIVPVAGLSATASPPDDLDRSRLSRANPDLNVAQNAADQTRIELLTESSIQTLPQASGRLGAYAFTAKGLEMHAQAVPGQAKDLIHEALNRSEVESSQSEIMRLADGERDHLNELGRVSQSQRWMMFMLAGFGLVIGGTLHLVLRLRRLQTAMQKQTSILQSVLDGVADGVIVVDLSGNVIMTNAMTLEFLGRDSLSCSLDGQVERYQLRRSDQVTPYTAAELPMYQAIQGVACDDVEIFARLPDSGSERWLNVSGRPLLGKSGAIKGGVILFSDVTSRKNAEAALRLREQQFRALVENTPDFVSRFDTELRRIYSNPALAQALGVPHASLIGFTPAELPGMPALSAQQYQEQMKKVLETGEEAYVQLSLRSSRSGTLEYQVRIVPERDVEGRITSALAIGRDVTAIMNTQRQLRTLLENLPDPVMRFDLQGRNVYSNPSVARAFDLPVHATGLTSSELGIAPDGRLDEAIRIVRIEARPQVIELPRLSLGEVRFFECRLFPEMDDQDTVSSVLCLLREVTEQKRSADLVQELSFRRETAREDERKSIARELHDELGQILSALRLEVSLLRLHDGRDHPAIGARAAVMLVLVDSVIRMQRDLVHSLRPVALDMGICAALEWLAGDFMQRSGVACELRLVEAQIDLDADQTIMVFRIVQESLTNVQKHARCEHVLIELVQTIEGYRLTVEDDGEGFDRAVHPSPKSFGLIGMGERAQMLRGSFSIHSSKGAGARIVVNFPASAEKSRASGVSSSVQA